MRRADGSEATGDGIAEFGRHQLVLDLGRPGRDLVQTIVTHRQDSSSCEKPGWLSASTKRRTGVIRLATNVAISSPGYSPPGDSRQEANTSRFTDCSEAQMRSVADDDICEPSHDGCWRPLVHNAAENLIVAW